MEHARELRERYQADPHRPRYHFSGAGGGVPIVQPWPQPSASFLPDPLDGRADVRVQEAPFALRQGESLQLRIYLDRSVLEVFANGRQCMAQRIYPTRGDSTGVALFSRGGAATVRRPRAWDLAATNPW